MRIEIYYCDICREELGYHKKKLSYKNIYGMPSELDLCEGCNSIITHGLDEIIKTRLGAALKQTITRNYPSPYADDPETDKIEKIKSEIGAESVTDISWKISETSLFTSKLELFSALTAVDEIDVNWDNIFTTKISKYFNINLNVKLFYDKDISAKRQLKQALALGLTYNFIE